VTAAEAVLPSADAVIVAVPIFAATTPPLAEMLATDGSEELHVAVRSSIRWFPASRNSAVNDDDCPRASVTDPGETVTLATGARTFTDAESARFVAVRATIHVVPCDAPATTLPFASTVAIEGSREDHPTRIGDTGWPLEFVPLTPNDALPPAAICAEPGVT
jgi:hypothetical protein